MKCSKNVVWWLVNGRESTFLAEDEKRINALQPLVGTLFPGINYYSVTGFGQVMTTLVVPVLKKQFSDLQSLPEESVIEGEVEITKFLPSNGYEWKDSSEWATRFEELLAAA